MYLNGSLGCIAVIDVSIKDAVEAVSSVLNNMAYLDKVCTEVIKEVGLTIISSQKHQFEPYGVTMLYLLAESHLSIHTWPEYNCFSMDVHSCNHNIDVKKIKKILNQALDIKRIKVQTMNRGV